VTAAVQIAEVGRDRLDDLEPLYAALHVSHRDVSAVTLTEPLSRAWAARRATYAEHLDAGRALVHVASRDGRPVGYAFTILHAAGDDTFPLAPGYAELYTLAVLPEARGRGIGTQLLDAVDAALDARGVASLVVAVMAANADAIRLYERRGLVAGEVLMYRLRPAGG
jgi:ribosomal protein S18 acetylase RimI-like enzyme